MCDVIFYYPLFEVWPIKYLCCTERNPGFHVELQRLRHLQLAESGIRVTV